jgi:hypothetical protein
VITFNLSIPKKDPSELMLYLWKIIDIPKVSEEKLVYLISFDLFLVSPAQALKLIQNSIKNDILVKNPDKTISLNNQLKNTLSKWQSKRKKQIRKREQLHTQGETTLKDFKKESQSDFNVILKAFLDKGTINRAVTVSENAFSDQKIDIKGGLLNAKVSGSKEEPYIIKIDMDEKTIMHDCHDFVTRRSRDKKFCKHLARFFLLLKEQDRELATNILNKIADDITEWDFTE